jgi:TatA/E family protein of Tat protein translocase
MLPSLGMPELIIILVIALIIFGPRKLPELGRSLGKSIGEFRKASNELKSTLEEEIRLEEQKEQRAKMEAEQASAISAASMTQAPLGDDASTAFPEKPDEPTVGRTNTGTPA